MTLNFTLTMVACALTVGACTLETGGVRPFGLDGGLGTPTTGSTGTPQGGGVGTGGSIGDATTTGDTPGATTTGSLADGGNATTGEGGGGTDGGPTDTGTPRIPEATTTCPTLQSGMQTILGLRVEILAGTPKADGGGPLLFYWHGAGQSSAEGLGGTFSSGLLPASVKDDILAQGGMIVAPNNSGLPRAGQDVTFLVGVWFSDHDLGLADLITACAVENHGIDPRRIYTTGCDSGGMMAGSMALLRSSYVAAATTNSGGLAIPDAFDLEDPEHVPPVMLMHGGQGDNTITNFGRTSGYLRDVLRDAGGLVVDCNHGMGHCGAPVELQEAAWQFMQDHPFGASSTTEGQQKALPSYCTVVD